MRLRCMVLALCVAGLMVLPGCGGGPSLRSIEVIPNSLTFGGAGLTAQLQAIAHYSKKNGTSSTQDVTSQVTWKSASTDVATVDTGGKVTSKGPGTIQITASLDSGLGPIVGIATVTVSTTTSGTRELQSIAITPAAPTLTALGQTVQFVAIGTFTAAPTTQDLTSQCSWQSSTPSVASIGASTGLATANGPGSTAITAKFVSPTGGTVVGTANLTVNIPQSAAQRELVSVSIIPTSQTLTAVGQTAKFTAVGTFTTAPITAVVDSSWLASPTWDSSVPSVATIAPNGVATTTGPGTTAITATAPTVSGPKVIGTATLTESATSISGQGHDLISVTVIPSSQPLVNTGQTAQFLAVGTYATAPIINFIPNGANGVVWGSSAQQVATIDRATGLATAVGPGTATMTAIYTDPLSSNQRTVVGQGTVSVDPKNVEHLPLLTVFELGSGSGAITSSPASISCPGTCSATFPAGSQVTLTASTAPASWSANCDTSAGPNTCKVTIGTSTIVGAIF